MAQQQSRELRSAQRPRREELAALIDDWVERLEAGLAAERDGTRPAAPRKARSRRPTPLPSDGVAAERAAPAEASLLAPVLRAGVAEFGDAFGGRVALKLTARGAEHPGGVAVRGPASPPVSAFQAAAGGAPAGRALEFVAAWCGAPFDALRRRRRGLAWGVWGFGGARLAQTLGVWKRSSPGVFAALLGAYGVDVDEAPASAGSVPRWRLKVDDGRRVSRGRAAGSQLAADPPRLAALARAGREPGAQLAQIDGAWRLAGAAAPLEPSASAREWAAWLLLALRLGPAAAGRAWSQAQGATESERLHALARTLRRAGRGGLARQVLRALASPELEP